MTPDVKALIEKLNKDNGGEHFKLRELYGVAVEQITDQETAAVFFSALCAYAQRKHGTSIEDTIKNEKGNLGYYAGYYEAETNKRVWQLFDCQHPVFGTAIPTPDEAFKMGQDIAKKNMERSL